MSFTYVQQVKFRHCDPAGIVFYPRYFEMTNDTVEAFFADVLELPFSQVIRDGGVPTAQISTRFTAPSRIGEVLHIDLQVNRVGRSSLDVTHKARCGEELRFDSNSTLVLVDGSGKSTAWPERVRTILQEQIKGAT